MRQGEVWWATLGEPVGRRPVVLLSRNEAYQVRNAVTVAIVTRTIRNIPVEVRLGPSDGFSKDCVCNLDTIITIGKDCLNSHLTTLSPIKWKEVIGALKFAMNIP